MSLLLPTAHNKLLSLDFINFLLFVIILVNRILNINLFLTFFANMNSISAIHVIVL